MQRESWERVSDLFDAALDRPISERRSYLEQACVGDEAMLGQVLGLLSEFERAGSFLEQSPFAPKPEILVGSVISERYRIEALLGRGGMGDVYRAVDTLIGDTIALKILSPRGRNDAETLLRFRREVRLARKVTHPSVCRVQDAGVQVAPNGRPLHFLAMQLLEGETLASHLKRSGPLSIARALTLAADMASGLEAAHAAGIVHRDFKSANVMLCSDRAVITDFGLARIIDAKHDSGNTVTTDGQLAGTIAYMSPEQLSGGTVTTATDIYSFGVVLFEMVVGKLPFDDPHIIRSAMARAKEGAPDVRAMAPQLNANWASVISRCLHHDPAKRFPNASTAVQQLRSGWRPPPVYWTRREWTKAAIGVGAVAAVALVPSTFRFIERRTTLPDGAEIFLAPFTNMTADARFDSITELLRGQLSQSARLSVIDNERVADALERMGMSGDAPIDPQAAREAGWRLSSALSIYGNVTRIGTDYVLNVQAETRGSRPDSPTAKFLRSFSAGDPAALMRSTRDASIWIREISGESATSIAAQDRLPADTTTPSWEALSYFARGQALYVKNQWDSARLQFEAALEEDPDFTLAAMRRADILMSQNQQISGISQWRAAIGMLDRRQVTRSEELYGRGMFAFDSGDMESAERYARTWSVEYPHDWRAPYFRALPLCLNGQSAQAVEVLEGIRSSVPDFPDLYAQLIACHLVRGATAEARDLVPILRRLGRPERAELREAFIRYREGDCVGYLQALRNVQRSEFRGGAVDALMHEGLLCIDTGFYREAATNIDAFLARGSWIETLAGERSLRLVQAWAEMLDGNGTDSVRHARLALSPESGPLIVALAGTVFARSGAAESAAEMLQRTESFADIRAFRVARHRITGEIARANGDADGSIREMRAAAELEPVIAHRQYLIEALPAGSAERLELAIKAAQIPWQVMRPPALHHIGAIGTVRAELKTAGVNDAFVTAFDLTSQDLASYL